MSATEIVCRAMESSGYQYNRGLKFQFGAGSLIEHQVDYYYWGRTEYLGATYAFTFPPANLFARKMAEKYLIPPVVSAELEDPLVRFSLGKSVGWGNRDAIFLAGVSPEDLYELIVRSCTDFLKPLRETITTKDDLFDSLYRDEPPMKWRFCTTYLRAAVVIYLAKAVGRSNVAISKLLKKRVEQIRIGWPLPNYPVEDYIERVIKDSE